MNRGAGERGKFNRNREVRYLPGSVKTDGQGGILDRPLTTMLPCFADVVEWLLGQYDRPYQWHDKPPEPKGCAMCPLQTYCAQVAWERITTSSQLKALFDRWEQATSALPVEHRYRHQTWCDFVTAAEAHSWPDSNDEAVEKSREDTKNRNQIGSASKKQRRVKRAKAIAPDTRRKITEYRDSRELELVVSHLSPKPPLWIRNRRPERCRLIADSWEARQMFREAGMKPTGPEIVAWLIDHGRIAGPLPARIVELVNEALKRADRLLSSGEWPPFGTQANSAPRQTGHGMHPAAVFQQIDP